MKRIISILSIVLLFAACNTSGQKSSNISADDFQKQIAESNIQLVDVRTPEEYAQKHLANAKNININSSSFETEMNALDKSKPLYVYCLSGGRSGNAADWAHKNGFKEVYNLEGGVLAWMNNGKPVVKGEEAAVKEMSQNDYLAAINKEKLVMVDFNAVWCGPCKVLKPRVKKVVKEMSEQVELLDIDVDKNPAVSNYMNVQSIPLLILYKQGKEVWRKLGVADEAEMKQAIQQAVSAK
jgi:thioredoxin 1